MMPNRSQMSQPSKPSQKSQGKVRAKKAYSRELKLEALQLLRSSSKTKAALE